MAGWLGNGVDRPSARQSPIYPKAPAICAETARILSDLINEWHLHGNWHHQWVARRNAVEALDRLALRA